MTNNDTPARPNIVLVFMDDMGYGDMGAMGGSMIKTPNMDRVAAGGIAFRQMYAAASVCTPSRAALLTGRYAQRVGLERVIFPQEPEGLSSYERTMADLLSECGYRTAIYGKWHLGARPEHNPLRHGFEEFFGIPYSNDMDPVHLFEGQQVAETYVDQSLLTKAYTDRAIDFISNHADEPFFVYLPHTMPHIPLHVEEGFRGQSRGGTYGDTIECIDHHLGRLLDHLDQLELSDNTLVIVTSDNGPWFEGSTGGLRGRKGESYEGGIRMPFVARWPAEIPAGIECNEPAGFIDLMPTLVTLAGGKVPDDRPIDGCDISATLRGEPMPERAPIFTFHQWSLNAVRDGRWKLHVRRRNDADQREMPQLFDMESDPTESYNQANREPEVLGRMLDIASRFAQHIHDQQPEAMARANAGPVEVS
ncbi:sulfatase family protein [Microlunatus soli]|uniref:Uncharacterized sulfatase n=1 Tax=Microlunatus soli TaxID=630515 RepID=A0A1H1RK95_9ACTN|nr:sulfatase [Microlunatus soli]SDS36171.1 uncharacterized sulfatase [Microlunatus soli]